MPLDLAFTLVAVFAIFFLGCVVYFNDRGSATNTIFFYISFFTVFWALSNYFSLNPNSISTLYFIRLVLFFATPHAILFLLFVSNFPNIKLTIPRPVIFSIVAIMLLTMAAAVSPYVFSSVTYTSNGVVPVPGPLIPFYALVILGSLIAGLVIMIRKYTRADKELKRRWLAILLGVSFSYFLLIITQFVFVTLFKNTTLVLFAPLFMLPAFLGVVYATVRYRLLEAKALVVETLVFALLLLTLFELLTSTSTLQVISRTFLFSSFFLIGVFLIRAILKEVDLREQLQVANTGQENLIHIMNHQIKGYLGKARDIFAELESEPEYGVSEKAKPMLAEGLRSVTEGVDFVQQVLLGSSAEKGTLMYNMIPTDFRNLVEEVADKQKHFAAERHLTMSISLENGNFQMKGDPIQLKEALRDLIDNSILYTPSGSIDISLKRQGDKALLSIKDTGVGITPEDMQKLFQKGGRGKDSLKYNVNSTGYGLAFVRGVIDAHKGRVWAESEGAGKGSVFHIELPLS